MKKYLLLKLIMLSALICAIASPSVVNGNLIYTNNFTGTDGTLPANWSASAGADTLQIKNNEYRLDLGTDPALTYFNGTDLQTNPASTWSNYTVSTEFRQTGSAIGGLVARVQNATSFYTVRLNSGTSTFELYRIGGPGTLLLDSQTSISYPAASIWTMELSVNGSNLTARLLDTTLSEVAVLTATDTAFTTGSAGYRGDPNNNVIVWDNFSVASIPEPATISMMLIGAIISLIIRRAR